MRRKKLARISQKELNILILGNSLAGKTSLLERYADNMFCENLYRARTIGDSYRKMKVKAQGRKFNVGIWNTAGIKDKDHPMIEQYFKGVTAAIVCYDMTEPLAFEGAKQWASQLKVLQNNCEIYLCATKKDLCEKGMMPHPPVNIAKADANEIRTKLFITSSKTGENIAELFDEILQEYSIRFCLKCQQRKNRYSILRLLMSCCNLIIN